MKEVKRELRSMLKDLNSLGRRAERIAGKLDKLEAAKAEKPIKTKPAAEAKKKATAKRPRKVTAIDTVFGIIKRSRKGVGTAVLKEKTGFDDKKIWNIINRLKQQGRIKSVSKGVYVKI